MTAPTITDRHGQLASAGDLAKVRDRPGRVTAVTENGICVEGQLHLADPDTGRCEDVVLEGKPADLPAPLMHAAQADVLAFHNAFGLTIADGPPALRDEQLRADLILEEARETAEALTGRSVKFEYGPPASSERGPDLIQAIDGFCDLLCVVYGAAVTIGVNLAVFWPEVHRSNMAKAGGPRRADGKQLKPDGWQPPDIADLLEQHYGAGE